MEAVPRKDENDTTDEEEWRGQNRPCRLPSVTLPLSRRRGGEALTSEDARRLEAFLKPSHIVVVATIGRNGMPHLTPNWYYYANETLMISTTKERVKYRNLTRDNRMTVCIYSEPRAQDYVTLWGHVSIRDDASIWPDTRAIVE